MSARRVLITGGSQRLGALLCRAFAQDGWEVWCHYHGSRDRAEALATELRAAGQRIRTVAADLSRHDERAQMLHTIASQSGALHCLVNNASTFEPDTAQTLEEEALNAQMAVNLTAPLHLSRLLAEQAMPDALPGARSIVHVLDQKVFNLNPDYFSYTVTKLALERSVALQAQALAPHVRVCGVAPGLMFLSGPQTTENFAAASRVNLLQHPLDPAQVASTCLFLANNPCINGSTLCVDNGQHLVPLARDVMFAVQDNLPHTL